MGKAGSQLALTSAAAGGIDTVNACLNWEAVIISGPPSDPGLPRACSPTQRRGLTPARQVTARIPFQHHGQRPRGWGRVGACAVLVKFLQRPHACSSDKTHTPGALILQEASRGPLNYSDSPYVITGETKSDTEGTRQKP